MQYLKRCSILLTKLGTSWSMRVIRTKSVDRKPAVLPGEHVGSRIGVEEPLHSEPPHDPALGPFGEGREVGMNTPSVTHAWRWRRCAAWTPSQAIMSFMIVPPLISFSFRPRCVSTRWSGSIPS